MAFNDSKVVNVPEPANIGKPSGTKLPAEPTSFSDLKKLCPLINSNPKINTTKAPAMANDLISRPIIFSNCSPTNKKSNINKPAKAVTENGLKLGCCCLKEMTTGTDPITSIIANRVKEMVMMSLIRIELRGGIQSFYANIIANF